MPRNVPNPVSSPALLTPVALARLFRVSRITIGNWRRAGCPVVLILGDRRDFPRYELGAVVRWRESKGRPVPGWVRARLTRQARGATASDGGVSGSRPRR